LADVRKQTALAYIDAYFAGEALALTTLMEHHAHEEWEASRARLSSSTGSSQEALALEAARGVAADETAEILQRQSAARLALLRWVGAPSDELFAPAALTVATEPVYMAAHPQVVALQRDLDLARQTVAVAATNRQANWTWEVAYGQRTGYSDMVSVGVSIPLQLAPAQRQDRETTAKLALVEKAEADLAEAIRAATTEYRTGISEIQRLQERIERYRAGVVAPTVQRTAAVVAAYRSNQAPLVTLFEARHAEVEAQRKLLALRQDLAKAQVQLAYRPLSLGVAP
jgi:outer membrane protein TolC